MIPKKYQFLLDESGPKMLIQGLKLYSEHEIPGRVSNPRILQMARETSLGSIYTNDDISWCALTIRYLAYKSGKSYEGTTLMARSWVNWGDPVSTPMLGDVLIFWRGKKNGTLGHVGLYVAEDKSAYHVLGGNQGNSVSITRIAKTRLLAARNMYNVKPNNVRRIFLETKTSLSENEV